MFLFVPSGYEISNHFLKELFNLTSINSWNDEHTSDKSNLKDGKTIGGFITVDNPEAFSGWVNQIIKYFI